MKHRYVPDNCACLQYYENQAGGEIPVFKGATYQYGTGLGDIFKSIIRVAQPIAKAVLPHVAKMGSRVLADVASGNNVKSSLKRRGFEALDDVITEKIPRLNALKRSEDVQFPSVRRPIQVKKKSNRKKFKQLSLKNQDFAY